MDAGTFLGVDIGKSGHYAVAVDAAGKVIYQTPVANDEAALRKLVVWAHEHQSMLVVDQPGVIADIAAALRDEQVSMESMIQRGRAPGEVVPVVLTTHATVEAAMRRALDRIAALDTVFEPPRMIRIEDF